MMFNATVFIVIKLKAKNLKNVLKRVKIKVGYFQKQQKQ